MIRLVFLKDWAKDNVKKNEPYVFYQQVDILKAMKVDERVIYFEYDIKVDNDIRMYYGALAVYFSNDKEPQFVFDVLFENTHERDAYIQRELMTIPRLTKMDGRSALKSALRKDTVESNKYWNYNMPEEWPMANQKWKFIVLTSYEFYRLL